MGANFSQKDSKRVTKEQIRHVSCDLLDQVTALPTFPVYKRNSRSRSFDIGPISERLFKNSVSSSSGSGDSFNTAVDFPDHRFAVKVQTYLRSIERMGEITNLNFHFGHMYVQTDDGYFSVEVNEEGMVPFVSLEEQGNNHNSGFLTYTYNSSGKGLNSKYSYSTYLYFSDIHEPSKNKVYVLQASMINPYGKPRLSATRVRTSDNPKLISHNSRFIAPCTFHPDQKTQTMISHISQHMEAYHLSQSDMSLDLSTDEEQALVFHFHPHKA